MTGALSIPTFNCCNLLFSSSNIFFFSSSDICIELLPAIVLIAELKPDGLKKKNIHALGPYNRSLVLGFLGLYIIIEIDSSL